MERQPKRRRRPFLSCVECRRRKIKCDRKEPCTHCVFVRARCIFGAYSDDEATVHIQPPIRDSATSPPDQARSMGSNTSAAGYGVDTRSINVDANDARAIDTNIQSSLLQRVQKLEESLASSPNYFRSNPSRNTGERSSSWLQTEVILEKSRNLGRNRPITIPREFEPIMICWAEAIGHGKGISPQNDESSKLVTQMGDLLQKCKAIAKNMKVARPGRSSLFLSVDLQPPSRESANTMANSYIRSFESTYRIVHIPTFWAEYQSYWIQSEVPMSLRIKILLVIGIGSSLLETDTGFHDLVRQWIYAAQTWLAAPEKDRLTITGLQIYCLTILAQQIFSIGSDLAWVSMGSLIHRAMQVGLHHDPKHLPEMPILHAELRRKLWATILEMMVQSSLDSRMPPRISFDEFDTEAPSNVNDDEMDESTTSIQPHPKEDHTDTSIQLLLFESLPTRLRTLRLLNGFRSELSYTDTLTLDREIADICRKCRNFMKANDLPTFHRNLLDFFVRRFLIWLHLPFATEARTNPVFYYSLKVSLDASMAMFSPEPDEGFHRLMVEGGLFREGIRHGSIIILLELLAQVEDQRIDGTSHRNSQHIELLKRITRDIISLSFERVQRGETNVKGHMFPYMVKAQAEAIEAGTVSQANLAQSAVESLELCLGSLRAQADSSGRSIVSNLEEGPGFDFDFEFDPFLPELEFLNM